MGTVELRSKLIQLINSADEKYLAAIFAFTEQKKIEEESNIVAYSVLGEPLTKEMYIEKVKDADATMDAGKFITSEELEKRIDSW